ncbi:MAG: hypothetical protein G5701_02080 [Serratia symbiotica]|nr:hypothetical protein [Serratia symbiotica]
MNNAFTAYLYSVYAFCVGRYVKLANEVQNRLQVDKSYAGLVWPSYTI